MFFFSKNKFLPLKLKGFKKVEQLSFLKIIKNIRYLSQKVMEGIYSSDFYVYTILVFSYYTKPNIT